MLGTRFTKKKKKEKKNTREETSLKLSLETSCSERKVKIVAKNDRNDDNICD